MSSLKSIPATTDAKRLAEEIKKRHDAHHMSVVFSTYHSLDVISRAQHLHGLPPFDLVICDEAHVSARIQDLLKEDSNPLNVDAVARSPGKRLNPRQRQRQRRQFLAEGPHADLDDKNISKSPRSNAHCI